jgi:hypothetical protein
LNTNIARTFAALNATNEAILYAKSPEELYEKVCEAAFSSGDFLATAIFLLEPGTPWLRFAAGFGEDTKRLRSIDISIEPDTPEGSGGGAATDLQRPQRRRTARHPSRRRVDRRSDCYSARADVGKSFVRAGQFRSRGRAQGRRAGDAAAEPDVRRHQRDQ